MCDTPSSRLLYVTRHHLDYQVGHHFWLNCSEVLTAALDAALDACAALDDGGNDDGADGEAPPPGAAASRRRRVACIFVDSSPQARRGRLLVSPKRRGCSG